MIRTPWSPASRSRSPSKRWCASAVASAATAAWCKRFQTRPATGPNKKSGSRMQHSVSIVNMNQYGSNRTYCELACTGVMCAGMCIMSAIYSRLLVTLEASAKCNTIANATTFSSHRAARGTAQQGEVQNVGTRQKTCRARARARARWPAATPHAGRAHGSSTHAGRRHVGCRHSSEPSSSCASY